MMNKIYLILFFLILFIALVIYYKKSQGRLFLFVLAIYAFSAFISILYYFTPFYSTYIGYNYEMSISTFLFWGIAFFVISSPLVKYDKIGTQKISYDINVINAICQVCFFVSLIPFLEMLPHLGVIFTGSSHMAEDIQAVHREQIRYYSSIGAVCMQVIRHLYLLLMACIIPLFLSSKKNKLSILGVVISILAINLSALLIASRVMMVTTIINIFLIYVLLYPVASERTKNSSKKVLLLVLSIVFFAFALLTFARGAVKQDRTSEYSILLFVFSYIGQGILNFNIYMDQIIHHTNGSYCFLIFKQLLGIENMASGGREGIDLLEGYIGIPTLVFYTFIGFFVIDIGYVGTLVFFSLIALLIRNEIKRRPNGEVPFHVIFLVFVLASVVANGSCVYAWSWSASSRLITIPLEYLFLKTFYVRLKCQKKSNGFLSSIL